MWLQVKVRGIAFFVDGVSTALMCDLYMIQQNHGHLTLPRITQN
jgi:hypothetical protein